MGLPWKVGSGMVKGRRSGVFFCAVVGDRTYLRFVAADDAWGVSRADDAIVREVGTCLRLIECERDTPASLPPVLEDRVYDFWAVAQQDIHADWSQETDPANLQPRVRPLNLRVAEHLRAQAVVDMPEDQVNRALDILEAPWPRREEVLLRDWFSEHEKQGSAGARAMVERVLATGLEPVKPAPLLPPIQPDDIEVLCWMGIEADAGLGDRHSG